ncbi:transporter substrate-binding protein [Bacillus sp. J33]|uniref:transporter substrate-binding protein n=1 Tax=Bacillus sp. J33 TaxID=935836 RepID=UPI0004BCC4BA
MGQDLSCRKAVFPVLEEYDCLLVYHTLYEDRECHPNVFIPARFRINKCKTSHFIRNVEK